MFERGGFVYVYESPEEAAGSIEWMDVAESHYLGVFSDRGEVIEMGEGALFATFTPTSRLDRQALRSLSDRAEDPRN